MQEYAECNDVTRGMVSVVHVMFYNASICHIIDDYSNACRPHEHITQQATYRRLILTFTNNITIGLAVRNSTTGIIGLNYH